MKNFLYDSLFALVVLAMVTLLALLVIGISLLLSIISPILASIAIGFGIIFGALGIGVILNKLFAK